MATLERLILDLLNPIELAGQSQVSTRAQASGNSSAHAVPLQRAALPAWMETRAPAAAQWEWFEAEPSLAGPLAGLEVTEHCVPAGWFERTFGVAGSGTALAV